MKEVIVILDNIRSALNVGAILRTCDGAGVSELWLCGITPNPEHPKVVKTALGAEKLVKCRVFKTTMEATDEAKNMGFTTVAIEQGEKYTLYNRYEFAQKTALIFGNEITGVSQKVLSQVDIGLEVPMVGTKNSLNVATTVGIVCYHIIHGSHK